MPWHALTFDGLDQATDTGGDALVTTELDSSLLTRTMVAATPHIQKAVAAGINDAVEVVRLEYKQKATIGLVAVGGITVLALVLMWQMKNRLQECCPVKPLRGCD
jgi:hypothetical protein